MIRAAARRLHQHVGRRGVFLILLGIGKCCWGVQFIVEPVITEGLTPLLRWAPLNCWAWVWIAAGLATFAAAWLRTGRDRWGYIAASVPPTLWALSYAWAAASGYHRGWFVAAWYVTAHVGVIWWAARVPNGLAAAHTVRPGV